MQLISHLLLQLSIEKVIYTSFSVEKNLSKDLISRKIDEFVDKEAILFTDEYSIYSNIIEHEKINDHLTVNHSQKEYANGNIHVNNCENRHSLLRPFFDSVKNSHDGCFCLE